MSSNECIAKKIMFSQLVCFVVASLLEMQLANCVSIDKKTVTITGDLLAEKSYLKPLYDFINRPKPVKIDKIAESYSVLGKHVNELMETVGGSLEALGLAEAAKAGLLGNQKSYVLSGNVDQRKTD